MKQNQNTIAAIDHKRAIRINSSWPFLTFPSVAEKKKLAVVERLFTAAIVHKRAIKINSWPFLSFPSVAEKKKKLAVVERLFIAAIDHKRAIKINSWPFLTFPSVAEKKNWPLSRGYFGSWGPALAAVVERWWLWRGGRRREVAVLERWPL